VRQHEAEKYLPVCDWNRRAPVWPTGVLNTTLACQV